MASKVVLISGRSMARITRPRSLSNSSRLSDRHNSSRLSLNLRNSLPSSNNLVFLVSVFLFLPRFSLVSSHRVYLRNVSVVSTWRALCRYTPNTPEFSTKNAQDLDLIVVLFLRFCLSVVRRSARDAACPCLCGIHHTKGQRRVLVSHT